MDNRTLLTQKMKFKTILKFDAGADVFLKMIYVLA
ncbi:MAG: hypothetical protein ACI9E5_000702, partial [Candidatus Omnitrophota bacterium]